jgi:hypothetical protein
MEKQFVSKKKSLRIPNSSNLIRVNLWQENLPIVYPKRVKGTIRSPNS